MAVTRLERSDWDVSLFYCAYQDEYRVLPLTMAFNLIVITLTCSQAMKCTSKLLWLCILLLTSATPTFQVDITMVNRYGTAQICQNILPGVCCSMIPQGPQRWRAQAEGIQFRHLEAYDVAAVWQRYLPFHPLNPGPSFYRGCAGIPWHTRWGPGTWLVGAQDQHGNRVDWRTPSGANYVRLPLRVPPDSKTANWLNLQGMAGLVWGGGQWFARAGAAYSSGVLPRSRLVERGIRSPSKGTAYITQPPQWRYPNLIIANGTEYANDGPQSLIYKSTDGEVLHIFDRP